MRSFFTLVILVLLIAGCESNKDWKKTAENPEFIHRSVKQVTDVIVFDIFSPPVASRIYNYISVAGYEAGRHSDSTLVSLAGQLRGLESVPQPEAGVEYCYALAASEAILKVGKTLVFSSDKMDAFYSTFTDEFKATGIPKDVYNRSVAYGDSVAAHIIRWSSKDNYKESRSFPKYSISTDPSTWKPTPPGYFDAVEPHWNKIRTLVTDSASQFKPLLPTNFSIDKSSEFYKQAVEVYEMGNNLTDEQKQIAFFWDCNPFIMNVKGHVTFATKKISPGGHWMNITRVACTGAKASVGKSLEAYAHVSISLLEGFISCWDEKYRSKLIRPETYINTHINPDWIPLLQTPPFPEYTSGHSVISSAAAVALTRMFGDNFAYTDSTEVEYGLTSRSFTSFKAASEEAAISRMYGGIHYRPAVENGVLQGRAVGEFVGAKVQTRKK